MTISLHPGDRIRLLAMPDDPAPIQRGQTGTVVRVMGHEGGKFAWYQIDVAWDNGRTLMLVSPPDVFEIMERCQPSPTPAKRAGEAAE